MSTASVGRTGAMRILDRRVRAVAAAPPWLLAAVAGTLAYVGTLRGGLVYDDPLAVALAGRPLLELLPARYGLTAATVYVDRLVWGGWVPGFHLTNVALHAVACALVTVAAASLGAGRAVALWCGLLFAVHPVHVEAVASIENRKEILAMIFVAASLALHRRGGRGAGAGSSAAFLLAMAAKDVAAVGLAVMLPVADLLLGVRDGERVAARRRAVLIAAAALVATAWYAKGPLVDTEDVVRATRIFETRTQAIATEMAAVPELAGLVAVPVRLSADHPKNLRTAFADARVLAGIAMLGAWLGVALWMARWAPLLSVAMLWPPIMYAPLSNVLATLTPYPVAERYLYVPSFGTCLLAAMALGALGRPGAARARRRVGVALGTLLVVAAGARTARRVGDWRDDLRLWTAALRAYPDGSTRIHAELGMALLRAGQAAAAVPHLERAVALGPPEAAFWNNLGLAYWKVGRRDDAIRPFERAVAAWPEHQMMRFNLASALLQLGRTEEARPHLLRLADPATWAEIDRSVMVALAAQGATPASLQASIRRWLAGQGGG